ncbi:aminopeptidase P family protein [Parahaliea maris]|uniref:Aminopeptidase P family protein n=1 Tax=Parahaliea maris TaxID=2716870 RepID=A0A5C9A6D4_9GAMM|nr:aminopeptidase P family protein [Parahaliea maris]TXS96276.1 aminopeptidase P family protein [Parahaliea maris]
MDAADTKAADTRAADTKAADTKARLDALRALMRERGLDALLIPRADEYLGEYIPAHNERLRWVSGFAGSAGVVAVLAEAAAIFVDGRYTVQVAQQVDAACFEFLHLVNDPHLDWLVERLPAGSRVGCDPRLHTLQWYREARDRLDRAGLELVADTDNLVDACWEGRPDPVVREALLLPEQYSGESSVDKRQRIAGLLRQSEVDAALVFAPDAVSWLLNIRGTDVPLLPVLQSFALLGADGTLTLFVDPRRLPEGFARHAGEGVSVAAEHEFAVHAAAWKGRRILADPAQANAWTLLTLEAAGARLVAGTDPVLLPKACKNEREIAGARRAHLRDAVAEIRFLAWLDAEVEAGYLHDEAELADQLYTFRAAGEHFHGGSFDTISAAGANAAMCHYNHLNASQPGRLAMDSMYLLDSGAQYIDGTTDITRTIAIGNPGTEQRRLFTLVLKGHIALDQARFPRGTTGTHLDALARQFLWQAGFDYDHGTGHGVGSFLSVHEAPQRISKGWNGVALQPGMIVSNEPGYYRDGEFGIRCENLVVVRELEGDFEIPVLGFEALTLVPFDLRLVEPDLLGASERAWLDSYHQHVLDTVGPLLDEAERQWLVRATRPLGN